MNLTYRYGFNITMYFKSYEVSNASSTCRIVIKCVRENFSIPQITDLCRCQERLSSAIIPGLCTFGHLGKLVRFFNALHSRALHAFNTSCECEIFPALFPYYLSWNLKISSLRLYVKLYFDLHFLCNFDVNDMPRLMFTHHPFEQPHSNTSNLFFISEKIVSIRFHVIIN